ncbi:hypothetical protein ACFRAR_18935 [Kitasatospora sp. NPDC056651]|uniref:hypothetical protein n=1 Tax=Kitasatospora sp. NPDC056651 TaxID=3345892 RepID=UPI0036A57CFB
MRTVPASAPGLVALAMGVFALPLVLVGVRDGFHASVVHVVVAACFVPCVVALLWPGPGGFRAATVAAGSAMVPVAVFAALFLLWAGAGLGRLGGALVGLALPVATIASLVGAFQRAEGLHRGLRAAVVGRSVAALSVIGWVLLLFASGPTSPGG